MALALLALRIAMGIAGGWLVLRSADVLKYFILIPHGSVWVAVWAAGLIGDTVEWGGQILRLDRKGRIV